MIGKIGLLCVLILTFVVLIMPGVLAISTDLRESYQPGETIIVEISGNILEPIVTEDVEFRRGHVGVPFEFDVMRLGENYFLWAIAQENENDYTLVINKLVTTENGKVVEIDFEQNFSVVGELVDYSVKPGFVFAREDFEIEVQLNEDFDKEITTDFPFERNILLKPGNKNVEFSIGGVEGTQFVEMTLGKYVIPTFIVGDRSRDIGELIVLPDLRFNPRVIESTILIGDEIGYYPFQIVNDGDEDIELFLEFDDELFLLDFEDEFSLRAGEIADFNLSFRGDLSNEEINEIIYARSGNYSIELPIEILFTEDFEDVSTPYLDSDLSEGDLYYCSELSGNVCSAGETCGVESVASLDGTCCLGDCREEDSGRGSLAWIGWLIGAIVLIVALIVWGRYMKAKSKKVMDKVLEKREEREQSIPG